MCLQEAGLSLLLALLASGAVLDDHLPVEHRGGGDVGIPLGPDVPEPAADPAGGDAEAGPAEAAAAAADIEAELELQLRDSLPPGVLLDADREPAPYRPAYRPAYPAVWQPYPAAYLLPAVYSPAGRPLVPPVPWYLPQLRRPGQLAYLARPGLVGTDQAAPSVAASRIYDVTISSAHAPQKVD